MSNVPPLLFAIDLGSSSARCSVWRPDGTPVPGASAQTPLDFDENSSGSADDLRQQVEGVIDECLTRYREAGVEGEIVGVGWASFAMSWLGVDGAGAPVTPIHSYADRQSGQYAQRLLQRLAADGELEATYQRTGTPIHSAYAPAQLLRIAAEEPEQFDRVAHWQTVSAHLLARWTDRPFAPISSSEAGWTGLLNRTAPGGHRTWDETLLHRLPIDPSHLPPIHDYTNSMRGLSEPYADRWPELADVPFFLAVGDGAAANVGSGCTDPTRIALTIGTSGALRIVVAEEEVGRPQIRVPRGLWSYPIDARRQLVGGALTDGGSFYEWLQTLLAPADEDALLTEAADLPPDSHGLTVLPFLRGERSPGWATGATVAITGMTQQTTPAHVLRAGLEAVALRFRLILERLEPYLPAEAAIYASGGGLRNNAPWRQILADVLARPVHLTQIEEATSRGATLLAAEALGIAPPHLDPPPIIETAHPRTATQPAYRTATVRQQRLYAMLLGDRAQFL